MTPCLPILDVQPARPLDALFEAVRRRQAGERFFARIDFKHARTAFATRHAARILETVTDYDARVEAFNGLAREPPIVESQEQPDVLRVERPVVQTVREIVLLSEGVAVATWHEHLRLELSFGLTVEPLFVEPAPDRPIPAFDPSAERDTIVIWAPREPAQNLALVAFALEELQRPVCVVSAGGKKPAVRAQFVGYDEAAAALSRACVIVDPAHHPGNAVELVRLGVPLVVSLATGANERLDGVGVFLPWDRADVLRAVQSAFSGPLPRLRARSISIEGQPALHQDVPVDGPPVSIVVRTYDRPDLLERALQSLARQTYRNLEAVVVSDGGEDVSDVVGRFACARLIVHERNRGAVASSNTGLRESRGELIGLLDDDDVVFPDHVATLVAAYQRSRCEIVHADTISAYYDSSDAGATPYGYAIFLNKIAEPTDLYLSDGIGPMAALFRRDVALELGGYDEAMPHAEDWEFWLRLSQRYDFVHVPRVTGMYSIRDDGTNMMAYNSAGFAAAMQRIAEKHSLDDRPLLARVRAEMIRQFVARGAPAAFPRPALERR